MPLNGRSLATERHPDGALRLCCVYPRLYLYCCLRDRLRLPRGPVSAKARTGRRPDPFTGEQSPVPALRLKAVVVGITP